jgi:hypothetical protein
MENNTESKLLELKIRERQQREKNARGGVFIDLTYIDMADDLNAGLLLSQIMYWNSVGNDGSVRAKLVKDGRVWIAKKKAEWYNEVRLSEKQVRRAETILKKKGLVDIQLWKFGGDPMNHYSLNWSKFFELEQQVLLGQVESDQRAETSGTNASEGENKSYPQVENSESAQRSETELTKGQIQPLPKVSNDIDQKGVSSNIYNTSYNTTDSTEQKGNPTPPLSVPSDNVKESDIAWEEIKMLCKSEFTEIAIKTWFESLTAHSLDDGVLTLTTTNDFVVSIFNNRYKEHTLRIINGYKNIKDIKLCIDKHTEQEASSLTNGNNRNII